MPTADRQASGSRRSSSRRGSTSSPAPIPVCASLQVERGWRSDSGSHESQASSDLLGWARVAAGRRPNNPINPTVVPVTHLACARRAPVLLELVDKRIAEVSKI